MKTIFIETANEKEAIALMTKCAKNKVSFEFLNGNEFYFTIYDNEDFKEKQSKLGYKYINELNYIN